MSTLTLRNAALGVTTLALLCCGDGKREEVSPDKSASPVAMDQSASLGAEDIAGLPLWETDINAAMAACPGNFSAELAALVNVQIWAPPDMERKRIVRQTQIMQSIFEELGIRFQSRDTLLSVSMPAVFRESGTGKGAPLDRFINLLTPKTPFEVQIIFVPTIVSSSSAVGQGLTHLSGLTLSPYAAPSENSAELARLLGRPLENLPAPLLFLAIDELSKLPPEGRFTVLAHEMGHAFGLSHGGGRENIMEPKRHARCLSGFSQEQVEVLRSILGH